MPTECGAYTHVDQNACLRWHFIRKFLKTQSCTRDRLKTLGVHVLIHLGYSKLFQTLCFRPLESYKQVRGLGREFHWLFFSLLLQVRIRVSQGFSPLELFSWRLPLLKLVMPTTGRLLVDLARFPATYLSLCGTKR